MIEYKILKSLLDSRDSWQRIYRHLDFRTYTAIGRQILEEINNQYTADPDLQEIDRDVLREVVANEHHEIDEYLGSLPPNVSDENLYRLVAQQAKQKLAESIAVSAGLGDIDSVDNLIQTYASLTPVEEEEAKVYLAPKLDVIVQSFQKDNLIPIFPSKLSEILGGGVPRQTQIGIVARPDVGKTTVAMNMVVPMCEAGYKVLYFGNEDPDHVMIVRALTRFLRKPRDEIIAAPEDSYYEALDKGYENFGFISLQPGTMYEIEEHCKRLSPDVIVIDQIRNVQSKNKTDSLTENLNKLAQQSRALIKSRNMISVLITQAGESFHNKLVMNINDVEYSNTGFAGQLDLMIGVGQNDDFKQMGRIMFSFPKNKLSAPVGPMEAEIEYAINRVKM